MSKPALITTSVRDSARAATLEALTAILVREFEFEREAVAPDARLVEDLDLDSLDFVALAAALEESLDCTLEPEDVAKVSTVGELVDVLQGLGS